MEISDNEFRVWCLAMSFLGGIIGYVLGGLPI